MSAVCELAMQDDRARLDQDLYFMEHIAPLLKRGVGIGPAPSVIKSSLIFWDAYCVVTLNGLKPTILTREYKLPEKFHTNLTHASKRLELSYHEEEQLRVSGLPYRDTWVKLELTGAAYTVSRGEVKLERTFFYNDAMLAYEGEYV